MGHHLVLGPPRVIEAVAGALLPASRREDVLGDLHERYTSPLGYVCDAAQLIPVIVVSHTLRRRRSVASPATAGASTPRDRRQPGAVLVNWFALARPALFAGGWYVWLSMLGAVGHFRGASSQSETDAD